MNKKLHILHLEDSRIDAELIQAKLIKEGLECEITRVGTREDFTNALEQGGFDIILADYELPSFNGLSALMIAKEQCPDVPFILVSGAVGEELAVEILKKGATDYVLKGNLSRLVPAVHRAIEEAQERCERKKAEKEIKTLQKQTEFILGATKTGIDVIDSEFNIRYIDPEWKKVYGDPAGRKCYEYFMDRSEVCPGCGIIKALETKTISVSEEILIKEGNRPIQVTTIPFQDDKGEWLVAEVNVDITARKQMEEKLRYLAYYDALTGLPNRTLFLDRVNHAIARAEPASRIVAVLIINIDRFKSINDAYGSEIGDRVLKEIAGRLSTSVRKRYTIARLSNDEFGAALLDVAHPDDIVMVLEKIMKYISYPLKIAGDEITLTFSTGISLYPHDGENATELLKSAGLALSIAKKAGRKTCQFYTKDMNIKAAERMLLEKQLMKAIKNEEFVLHYQPCWDITTKKMVAMEALIRWQSKDKGLAPPGKFIPLLEDTGMIIEVGEWILRTAMRQVKEWQDKRYPVVPVSVNMSLVQFRQKNLAGVVKKIMGECGFYPSLLTLEITESAFMQDIEFTRSVLTEMKEIGCSVSIDDFGTGYSSLAYLKRLPVDNLKIDISFIREMVNDPDSASIVMAIINMAHTLNLKTIAEGIETEEQWNFLRLLRCDMGQGFYLSKPLPAEEMKKHLEPQ